jgi:murein DD-endopeptidase MepM/ murein hydrolase activator NlpD
MVLQQKRSFWKKIRDKYRFAVLNENTYEEVFIMRLSRLNVFSALGVIVVLITLIVTSVIAYTPLREFIPGYPDGDMIQNMIENEAKIDSISIELDRKNKYLDNLKVILSGGVPENYVSNTPRDTSVNYKKIKIPKSKEDSILRKQIESEDKYLLTLTKEHISDFNLDQMDFIKPLSGIITSKFNLVKKHYAIDIVNKLNSPIVSVLSGHVVFIGSTLEAGNTIYIQHENNILSVYKHLSSVNVKLGEFVKKGQVIAIIGNTGYETSGPHLHFELWNNGQAINPEEFINFE